MSIRLHEFREDATYVGWVDEGDRGAHGAVPGPRVEEAHPGCPDRRERLCDAVHAIADVVDPLATAGQEPPDGRVGRERREQLDPGRSRRAVGHAQHRLTDTLLLVDFPARHGELEERFVEGHFLVKVMADDPNMINPGQQLCFHLLAPPSSQESASLGITAAACWRVAGGLGGLRTMSRGSVSDAAELARAASPGCEPGAYPGLLRRNGIVAGSSSAQPARPASRGRRAEASQRR